MTNVEKVRRLLNPYPWTDPCQIWHDRIDPRSTLTCRITSYHIISYIIRTNVLEHTRHTSALTVAQKHNETFQRNSTGLKS